jgi:pimeloyl-ACP methyl ester carboxylesterase
LHVNAGIGLRQILSMMSSSGPAANMGSPLYASESQFGGDRFTQDFEGRMMTASTQVHSERFLEIAGLRTQVLIGGSGPPVVALHHDIGNPGWLPFYERLAERFSVYVPSLPGYGESERAEWMRSVRDLVAVEQWLLKELDIEGATLVGLGFGGWVAAEMVSLSPRQFSRLVLVAAMGMKPEAGEILDQAILNHESYVRAGFHDQARFEAVFGAEPETDLLERWDIHRETTFRIAWKPYMYNPVLPHLLGGISAPALVVCGREDRVVPLECGERYRQALPNARLEVLANCGHLVEMEQPDELARLVTAFAAS